MPEDDIDTLLFAQHGWADTNFRLARLANQLPRDRQLTIVPRLNWTMTWLRLEPLIAEVERLAAAALSRFPQASLRVIGHSMGGLMWLEVLHRHPDWWPRVRSLTLVGSPVGGSDLARIVDPWSVGVGIARDLGTNRRPLAEAIAAVIPTQSLAGDIGDGSDGTVPIAATQFEGAAWVCLPGVNHVQLKDGEAVAAAIRHFWQTPTAIAPIYPFPLHRLVRHLQAIPGMTDTSYRYFAWGRTIAAWPPYGTLRHWPSPWGVDYVFVADGAHRCHYGGFVGWQHREALRQALAALPDLCGDD